MSEDQEKVGPYEILGAVGRGGMSTVYLAFEPDLGRHVALKRLDLRADDPGLVARFLRESRLAASLSHPNIVTVFARLEVEGIPYIAMEYLDRGSLRPWVRKLTLPQVFGVLESTLDGLSHAHANNIVHRDLKPENLLITSGGGVKIADFGIAKALSGATRGLTRPGATLGTLAYMAPERVTAPTTVGPTSDLYALGVVAFELLCRRVPFEASDEPLAVLFRHVQEPAPPPISIVPDIDPRLSSWIERLLAKSPAERPQDAKAAWEDVEEIAVSLLGPVWRREARLTGEPTAEARRTPKRPTPARFDEPTEAPPREVRNRVDRERQIQAEDDDRAQAGTRVWARAPAINTSTGTAKVTMPAAPGVRGRIDGPSYVEDIVLPQMLFAAIVRSPEAHARIHELDISMAREMPGARAVLTGDDLSQSSASPAVSALPPGIELNTPDRWPLARGKTRYVGEPVAMVLGDDPYGVVDAAECIIVEYEPLPVIGHCERALAQGSPLVHEELGANTSHTWSLSRGDINTAMAQADVIVERRIVNHRIVGAAIEPRCVVADYAAGRRTLWTSARKEPTVAASPDAVTGFSEDQLSADEQLMAYCSQTLGRPVKWVETRSENLATTEHSSEQVAYVMLLARSDGTLMGISARIFADSGAYLQPLTPLSSCLTLSGLSGSYAVPAVEAQIVGAFTNSAPTNGGWGAGRAQATHVIEVMMDELAAELNMDPLSLRRRNFLPGSRSCEPAVEKLLELVDLTKLRQKQAELLRRGIHKGIGMCTYLINGWDAPESRVLPRGAHACIVDVDVETGMVAIERYVAVDDFGSPADPALVDDQIRGGIVHGIGQSLFESIHYDEEGQLCVGTFVDYLLPTASDVPPLGLARPRGRSLVNALGVNGMAELGTIASLPAVANAVVDALRPYGVSFINTPLTPLKLRNAVEDAS